MLNFPPMRSLLPALLALALPAAGAERPNILFIMTDDHAAHAMSCYGSRINQTPHLDSLAAGGMRFERCLVTNSICTPSRATILTGKYSHLNGVPVFNRFDGSQQTVAKLLQGAGYHTGMVGKWHLGSDPTGFDYWNILPGQGKYHDPVLYTAEGTKPYPGYVTDVITDLGIDFLKSRPPEKPFFLMLHHKAPHRAWEPDEKYRQQFAGKTIPEPATLWDDYATRTDAIKECAQKVFDDLTRLDLKLIPPADLKGPERMKWLQVKPTEVEIEVAGQKRILAGEELKKWKYQRYLQDYLACVQSVDDNIGRLLKWMEENGLGKNTVVFYTSDQGFYLGDHGLYDKRFMYEAALKMPFLVRWPGTAKPGSVQNAIATNCDFAPTFLEIAGQPVPGDMQGRSLAPLLRGETPADWPKAAYYRYYHDPGHHKTAAHYGITTESHKLIYFWRKDQWECYDLRKDPNELHNIANDPASHETVQQLKAELARVKKELKDEDQFANDLPKDGVDGAAPNRPRKRP